VKSMASIMRLPGSINTKPERGGVVMSSVELALDRRYSFAAFEWLIASAKTPHHRTSYSGGDLVHHPLPRGTLDYLAQGAANGQRNAKLFDAACQFRDACYSQTEAEAALIPRYLADGTNENPTTREREAQATITSAYHHPARDPLQRE